MNRPTLRTGCILSLPRQEDGIRISVMSRHTLNDGVTPDERIVSASFHVHFPFLGPSPKLIGDYYKRNLSWKKFEERYIFEQQQPLQKKCIEWLCRVAASETITLLCIEESCEYCHRRLLAQLMQEVEPRLKIEHC